MLSSDVKEQSKNLLDNLEKMIIASDKRQEQLMAENQRLIEETSRNTLEFSKSFGEDSRRLLAGINENSREISDAIAEQLRNATSTFFNIQNKFMTEFDKIRLVFKEAISTDFSKIFQDDFIKKLEAIKEQLLVAYERSNAMLLSNISNYDTLAEKNKNIIDTSLAINNELKVIADKIYSKDYVEIMDRIKVELAEITENSMQQLAEYVDNIVELNTEVKSANRSNSDFNKNLRNTMESIVDLVDSELTSVMKNKKNLAEINKLSSSVLEKNITKINELAKIMEDISTRFERTGETLSQGLAKLEDKKS